MDKIAIILGNYKDYAIRYLDECFLSIKKQDWKGEIKIFIYDNATSEESNKFIMEHAPGAEIVRNMNNDGFAKGNNDAIKLALAQGFEYIFLLNLDTIVEIDCLSNLILTMQTDEKIAAVQARLMLWPEKEKINSLGNEIHFLGFGYCASYNQLWNEASIKKLEIAYPSGAAVMLRSSVLKEIGLFDEEYWMYNEDEDLGWRIWLAGYKCVLSPKAIVYHKYEFSRSIKKYYWMERNRLITVLKNYKISTMLLLLPAAIVMETGLIIFSLKGGWFKQKIEVYKYFFSISKLRYILTERKKVQKLRVIGDRELLNLFSSKISYQEIDNWKLRFANPIFDLYWRLVKKIIIW